MQHLVDQQRMLQPVLALQQQLLDLITQIIMLITEQVMVLVRTLQSAVLGIFLMEVMFLRLLAGFMGTHIAMSIVEPTMPFTELEVYLRGMLLDTTTVLTQVVVIMDIIITIITILLMLIL
jgi:hypothetical protein